jgi:hypothetical protein
MPERPAATDRRVRCLTRPLAHSNPDLACPLRYRTGAGKWFQLQARDGTRSGVCARSRGPCGAGA